MASTLYVSGEWRAGEPTNHIHVPASSLVVLFSIQASCTEVPVKVVIVQGSMSPYLHQELASLTLTDGVATETGGKNSHELISSIDGHPEQKNEIVLEHESSVEKNSEHRVSNHIENDCSMGINGVETADGTHNEYKKMHFNDSDSWFLVNLNALSFNVVQKELKDCPPMVQSTVLPAVYCHADKWCGVGMCSSIRAVLHSAIDMNNDELSRKMMGFREGCLQSCAEVSCWTKFCEIEMPMALQKVFDELNSAHKALPDGYTFPSTVLRYNNHLSRPPILHNALKRKQQLIRKTVKDKNERDLLLSKKLCELPELDHDFAEGLDMTLADVMLYVCFDLIVYKLPFLDFNESSPLVMKWLERIGSTEGIQRALPLLDCIKSDCNEFKNHQCCVTIPKVIQESLYKSDPERPKQHCTGSMTLQNDIDRVINMLTIAGVPDAEYHQDATASISLPWSSYPPAVHPQEGELPPSRLLRKCQQLENMVSAVIQHCKAGYRIVDFCAGGGHLGIILAYCLPECTIALVENRSSSLSRAKARVVKLGLTNVEFYQCNLDYFYGHFDVGVCLHACGQATDLVLQKCYDRNASFVCSPCCYGSIQPNHSVQYPRSPLYRRVLTNLTDYLTLGHTADQTHGPEHPSTAQGQLCMRLIDGDRLAHASHLGYRTKLLLMAPVTCSPKNHVLVGLKTR